MNWNIPRDVSVHTSQTYSSLSSINISFLWKCCSRTGEKTQWLRVLASGGSQIPVAPTPGNVVSSPGLQDHPCSHEPTTPTYIQLRVKRNLFKCSVCGTGKFLASAFLHETFCWIYGGSGWYIDLILITYHLQIVQQNKKRVNGYRWLCLLGCRKILKHKKKI